MVIITETLIGQRALMTCLRLEGKSWGLATRLGLAYFDSGLELRLVCLDSRTECKDSRLTRDLQNNDLVPPLIYIYIYIYIYPSFEWDVKPRSWLSVVIKKSQDVLRKRVGWNPGILAKFTTLASDHHGLLIIPIHWLASSLCLLSTNKLVCGGRSGAIWLPSYHPGGCCTLVVDEEIPLPLTM